MTTIEFEQLLKKSSLGGLDDLTKVYNFWSKCYGPAHPFKMRLADEEAQTGNLTAQVFYASEILVVSTKVEDQRKAAKLIEIVIQATPLLNV